MCDLYMLEIFKINRKSGTFCLELLAEILNLKRIDFESFTLF